VCGNATDKEIGSSKRQESTWVIKQLEKQFQKNFVSGRNIVIDDSIIGFKRKIIFETYNKKKNQRSGASDYLH
jgi:hypothetical protein